MVFEWKAGSQIRTAPAVAAEVMTGLSQDNRLNPQTLVDVSRPEEAPLHSEFEWDDTTAAEKWRCSQASYIIRSLVVREEEEEEPTKQEPVRMFFKVGHDAPSYQPIHTILQSPESTDALIRQAGMELAAFMRKYNGILKKINATSMIDAIIDKLKGA